MVSKTTCCFIISIQFGLILWGCLKLIANVVLCVENVLAIYDLFSGGVEGSHVDEMIIADTYLKFLLRLYNVVMAIVLIVGVVKGNTKLLRIFLIGEAVAVIANFISLVTSFMITIYDTYGQRNSWKREWVFLVLAALQIGIQIYVMVVVKVQIDVIKEREQNNPKEQKKQPQESKQEDQEKPPENQHETA